MKKSEILEIIFIMGAFMLMFFSKNIGVRIISGVTILAFTVISKIVIYIKTKKSINKVKIESKNYILCRENKSFLLLIGFSVILNAMTNINNIQINKNREMLSNGENYIDNIMELINKISMAERVDIFIDIILIGLAIILIVDWFMSLAIISDDKITFHNGITYEFSEITDIKYRKSLFLKKSIIRLYKNKSQEELILKSNEFEKVKKYLEKRVTF